MSPSLRTVFCLFAVVLSLGLVVKLEGSPAIDIWIFRAAWSQRAHAGFWLGLSDIGAGASRVAIGLTAAAFLYWRKGWRAGVLFLSVALVQSGTNSALKALFARARPDLYPHLDTTFDLSYPSGHAAQNACLYVLIALMIDRRLLWVGVPLALLIGISRVVLGVHWPSDVLGGWLEGVAFALLGAHLAATGLASRTDP